MRINGKYELSLIESRITQWDIWNERNPPGWEIERIDSVMNSIGPGSVIYDIGSERGDFPALWRTTGADVVLVEPNPLFWPEICQTWELNHSEPPLGSFVGFCGSQPNKMGELFIESWPIESGEDLVEEPGFLNLREHPDTPVTTIDSISRRVSPPTAISVDVEGAELEVMKGASETLALHSPDVWISVHPAFMPTYGSNKEDLLDYMTSIGYQNQLLAVDHEEHYLFTKD